MKPDFSILIPTWKNLPFLKNCVRSIRAHTEGKFQLLIYANEARADVLTWLGEEGIEHLFGEENVGICRAMNALRPLVQSDVICYLNDDMYVLPGWDSAVMEVASGLKENYFISSTMIEPGSTVYHSIDGDYGSDLTGFQEDRLLQEYAGMVKEAWSGSSWPPLWLGTELWDEIGGFSEEFSPGMYSDPDMAMKAWEAGVRYFQGVGASRVYHFGKKSTGRLSGRNTGRELFLRKWGITARYFYKYYLRMGEEFEGSLREPRHPLLGLWINKWKGRRLK